MKGSRTDNPGRFGSVEEFKRLLEPLIDTHDDGVVVFDADGTLWSHDVGCMTFDWSAGQRLFREESWEPLRCFAREQGLSSDQDTVHDLIEALRYAFHDGRLNERATAEMQVWAYVGWSELEFRQAVRHALEAGAHAQGLHHEIVELAAWVRSRGRRAVIVSASPQWVVEEATATLGFERKDIVGGRPRMLPTQEGQLRIAAEMESALPYGSEKVHAGRRLVGKAPWLAALGDSSFDLDMFRISRLAGAIGAKEGLLAGLELIPHAIRLQLNFTLGSEK